MPCRRMMGLTGDGLPSERFQNTETATYTQCRAQDLLLYVQTVVRVTLFDFQLLRQRWRQTPLDHIITLS